MKEISHTGRIVEVTPGYNTVEIVSESACAQCHASAFCGLGDVKVKAVQVPARPLDRYVPGQEVYVNMKATMGHKAVWLGYVIPLLLMMASVLAALKCGAGELAAGLCGIGAVALYYAILAAFRGKLRNQYDFYIKPKDND